MKHFSHQTGRTFSIKATLTFNGLTLLFDPAEKNQCGASGNETAADLLGLSQPQSDILDHTGMISGVSVSHTT